MELRELTAKSHKLQAQLKALATQEMALQTQLTELEREIKTRLDASDEEYENLSEEEFQSLMADLSDPKQLTVEVVYVTKSTQAINEVQLARGASIEDSIVMSGLLSKYPDIDLSDNKVGIHGVVKQLSDLVADGDRIEIYRPVTAET